MTVSATLRRAGPFSGNGVASVFPFAFKVFDKTDVRVILTDGNGNATVANLDSDYSVQLNADQDDAPGGSITYPLSGSPMPSGSKLTVLGGLIAAQLTDLTNVGRYLPQVVENAFDYAIILIQQLEEQMGRTLQAAPGSEVELVFPAPSAGRFLRWRADLLGLENAEAGTDSMVLQALLLDPTKGAGMIGHSQSQAYPAGTVGAYLEALRGASGSSLVGHEGQTVGEALQALEDAFAAFQGPLEAVPGGSILKSRIVAALTSVTAEAERAKLTNETVRIHNASQRHIVLTDGTREAVIAMTADGGVRITAYAGTTDENSLVIPPASAVPVIQGNRGNNAALQSTLRALDSLGLVKDRTQ